MSDLWEEIILIVVGAAAGALSLYAIQNIAVARKLVSIGIKRICSLLNYLRRFILAKRKTRMQARAHLISRKLGISLAMLEFTLFRWYDKYSELLPFVQYVHEHHKNERVRSAAYELLWVERSAMALQVGDIVEGSDGHCLHVLHIRRDDEHTRVLWDATLSSTSGQIFAHSNVFKVTRGGWCTNGDCRYCNMSSDLLREIGEWWWRKEEAEQESKRLRRGGRNFSVKSAEDAEKALEGIDDWESVKVFYGGAINSPAGHDGEPAISASMVTELKSLARDGWEFQILRLEDQDYLPRVIMFEWCPPQES